MKHQVEGDSDFLIAGDSAYAISKTLMKPYPIREAANCRSKRLFNRRLSGLRTAMSECIFGQWKQRWPVIKSLRTKFQTSQKIIVATAILFNILKTWNVDEDDDSEDDDSEDDNDDSDQDENGFDPDSTPMDWNLPSAAICHAGQAKHESMRLQMP